MAASSVRPIRTKGDYEAALAEVERLWGAKAGTRRDSLFARRVPNELQLSSQKPLFEKKNRSSAKKG